VDPPPSPTAAGPPRSWPGLVSASPSFLSPPSFSFLGGGGGEGVPLEISAAEFTHAKIIPGYPSWVTHWQVTLTIRSDSGGATKEVPLSRQRLTFNPVTSQLCKRVSLGGEEEGLGEPTGKVGYIRVATFSKQTTENVKAALHQLQAEGANRCLSQDKA